MTGEVWEECTEWYNWFTYYINQINEIVDFRVRIFRTNGVFKPENHQHLYDFKILLGEEVIHLYKCDWSQLQAGFMLMYRIVEKVVKTE